MIGSVAGTSVQGNRTSVTHILHFIYIHSILCIHIYTVYIYIYIHTHSVYVYIYIYTHTLCICIYTVYTYTGLSPGRADPILFGGICLVLWVLFPLECVLLFYLIVNNVDLCRELF